MAVAWTTTAGMGGALAGGSSACTPVASSSKPAHAGVLAVRQGLSGVEGMERMLAIFEVPR
ncbi:MAG: hypothetical protein PVS2B3_15050 [Steroidobacteraceae bacterium]